MLVFVELNEDKPNRPHSFDMLKLQRVFLRVGFCEFRKPWCATVVGTFCDIFSHDCSLAYRLAIPHLKFSKKVTYIFVLYDLLRSVFLLKEVLVADFDPGSLDFVSL